MANWVAFPFRLQMRGKMFVAMLVTLGEGHAATEALGTYYWSS